MNHEIITWIWIQQYIESIKEHLKYDKEPRIYESNFGKDIKDLHKTITEILNPKNKTHDH